MDDEGFLVPYMQLRNLSLIANLSPIETIHYTMGCNVSNLSASTIFWIISNHM